MTGYTDSGDETPTVPPPILAANFAIVPRPAGVVLHRSRTEAELREALRRFCDSAWNREKWVHIFSIPPAPDDADLILADGIDELIRLRAILHSEAPHE